MQQRPTYFFARGLIMVEGDAENLLIPAIAQLIGRNLYKYGVSVVNVGSIAYKRYVNIFKRKDGKSFGMPIAVVSDLDVRALEYYDDNCSNRKTPKYWLKETLRPELEKISQYVNYDDMATLFGSKSAFEKEVRLHIKENSNPITETLNRMKDVLTDGNLTTLNEEMLAQIRKEKTEQLESEVNADGIKIFLPKAWTLEYEFAGSGLYRLLETAIRAAKKEAANQEQEITDEVLKNLWNEVINDYPEGNTPTKEVVYKIFEPLNEGTVSKAITAQYLAGMLAGELAPVRDETVSRDAVRSIVENDDKLKYLVEAIKYVTE